MPPVIRRRKDTIPTTKQGLAAHDRARRALLLRREGLSYSAIGKEIGLTAQGAMRAVQRELKRAVHEDAHAVLKIELDRLDWLTKTLTDRIEEGGKYAARNAEVLLKVMERRSALLGLDAAQRVEHEIKGPTVVEYFRDPRQALHRERVAEIIEGTVLPEDPVPASSGALLPPGPTDQSAGVQE